MSPKTVYWDANLFHAIFGQEEGRVEICQKIESMAAQGKILIYTSTVTFVEVVWIKIIVDGVGKINKLSPEHEVILKDYFMRSHIRPINCDRRVVEFAREQMWKHKALHPKDAIHVASAVLQGVELMHSYDDDHLIPLNGKVGNPPLRICHPGEGDGLAIPNLAQNDLSPDWPASN